MAAGDAHGAPSSRASLMSAPARIRRAFTGCAHCDAGLPESKLARDVFPRPEGGVILSHLRAGRGRGQRCCLGHGHGWWRWRRLLVGSGEGGRCEARGRRRRGLVQELDRRRLPWSPSASGARSGASSPGARATALSEARARAVARAQAARSGSSRLRGGAARPPVCRAGANQNG